MFNFKLCIFYVELKPYQNKSSLFIAQDGMLLRQFNLDISLLCINTVDITVEGGIIIVLSKS
jgi:hypothetical protein